MTPADLRPFLAAFDKSLADVEAAVAESAEAQVETANSMEQAVEFLRHISADVAAIKTLLGSHIGDAERRHTDHENRLLELETDA